MAAFVVFSSISLMYSSVSPPLSLLVDRYHGRGWCYHGNISHVSNIWSKDCFCLFLPLSALGSLFFKVLGGLRWRAYRRLRDQRHDVHRFARGNGLWTCFGPRFDASFRSFWRLNCSENRQKQSSRWPFSEDPLEPWPRRPGGAVRSRFGSRKWVGRGLSFWKMAISRLKNCEF